MPAKRTRKGTTGPQKKQNTAVRQDPEEQEHTQTAATELEGTTLVNDGDGFESQIFTILAGPQRQKFTAHASFLSQSPVLDRMCHGQFEESRTFTICLPDDRPDVIRAVIQYLYSRDIQKFGSVYPSGCTITALFDLAELYGVAEKYQLKGLKTVIIEKLETIIDVAKRPIEFLDVTKEIYNCIPDSDEDFRSFFRDAYTELLLPKDMP